MTANASGINKAQAKSAVVTDLFGANLAQQGRGNYIGTELFALIWGTHAFDGSVLPEPTNSVPQVQRRSHDFARRLANDIRGPLVTGPPLEITRDDAERAFDSPATRHVVAGVVDSLVVPIAGRRKDPSFQQRAFYPYVGELVHADAVDRSGRLRFERITSRGGGGLVHRILRTDPDSERLARVRDGFAALVQPSGSSVGRLMDALSAHDALAESPWQDGQEAEADPKDGQGSRWPEALRAGVDRILRVRASHAQRVTSLMRFVAFGVAQHQAELAELIVSGSAKGVPVDMGDGPSPIRNASRLALDTRLTAMGEGLSRRAAELCARGGPDADAYRDLATHRSWKPWLTFHTQTLAAAGALNAATGHRHYTLKPPLLEALVHATVEPGQEIAIDDFCDLLIDRYGMAVATRREGGALAGVAVDNSEIDANKDAMVFSLRGLGLLVEFSDQTQLVRSEQQ